MLMRLALNPFVNFYPKLRRTNRGFTLIELMIVTLIIAIGVALAVPSWNSMMEKRRLVAAAETVENFMNIAQSEAIKRNEEVTVSWKSSGGHSSNFCLGFSAPPKTVPCDCNEDTEADADFCSVDSVPYRMTKVDFVDIGYEFMHMRPATGRFGFDPIRGIVVNTSDNSDEESSDIIDNDYLFYMHSDEGSGSTRLFGLEMRMNRTGRFKTCSQGSRKMAVGGYPRC